MKQQIRQKMEEMSIGYDRLSIKTQIPKSTIYSYLNGSGDTSSRNLEKIKKVLGL